MTEYKALINVGELSKPATTLVQKIADAIGVVYEPTHMRRIAKAKADVEQIEAKNRVQISEYEQRTIRRLVAEEVKKQENMDSVTSKAIPMIKDHADSSNMENDWIVDFFEKARLISDDDMQQLWAALLASEASTPGTYSKRTLSVLSALGKQDAVLFQSLCSFVWGFDNTVGPLVFDAGHEVYNRHHLNFETLLHLDDLGLIEYRSNGTRIRCQAGYCNASYFETQLSIDSRQSTDNNVDGGLVLFSQAGSQLAPLCEVQPVSGFVDYVIEQWSKRNHTVKRI